VRDSNYSAHLIHDSSIQRNANWKYSHCLKIVYAAMIRGLVRAAIRYVIGSKFRAFRIYCKPLNPTWNLYHSVFNWNNTT